VRLTIAVPVYNGERYLRETFECINAQTFSDFEVVISDNASTDGTEWICRDFAARDPRVRYVRNIRNVGMATNFERLVELARGEYFKLATADDRFDARLVAECVAVLDAHPEVALCYGKTTLIDEDGKTIRQYEDNLDLREPRARTRYWLAIQRLRLVNVLHGVIRTAALRRAGPLGTYVGADMVLVPGLALQGQFRELPEFLFHRRIHPGAFSSIHNDAGEREFWNPLDRRSRPPITWQRYHGHARAIVRAPLSLAEKVSLLGGMLGRALGDYRDLILELRGLIVPPAQPAHRKD
jgi:glycosyltransferase involved in cell wall biosynthesis